MIYVETHDKVACRVCGTTTSFDACLEVSEDYRAASEAYVMQPRMIGHNPVCYKCSREWDNLSRKTGREILPDEFCLWMLARFAKGKHKPKEMHEGDVTVTTIAGTIYADFLSTLMQEIRSQSVRVECPRCGDKCKVVE